MKYAYLGLHDTFPIIIFSTLTIDHEERLVVKVEILKWLDVGIIHECNATTTNLRSRKF
ncbi:unnamed protein product [Spirodela intermedia]|uniref:Uncharacterized protein n=1 Tax=Spirodela intermedia TaxID=51605 RepID=A0A7I8LAX8_SPIIN|nr:unnamed protein product [Spirodela intermedia]